MTTTQTSEQLEMYTSRTIEKLKKEKGEIDEKRIKRLIELYYPDFRVIASQIEFEFV
jgi:hypothetical protein